MEHQDWKPVVLCNFKIAKENAKKNSQPVKRVSTIKVKDVGIEEGEVKIEKIHSNLKNAIIQVRLSQQDKQLKTQEGFSKRCQLKLSDLKELEQGKIGQAQAKQIALKIEKHLKVKVLESINGCQN
jgi:hypothetical protein